MILDRFGIEPDYPFAGDFVTAVFRRKDNLKWFAIVMSVDAKKLKIGAYGELDIVNLKCTDEDREALSQTEVVLPAYHMNKKDGSVSFWMNRKILTKNSLNSFKKVSI